MHSKKLFPLSLATFLLLVAPWPTQAKMNSAWQTAVRLRQPLGGQVQYGTLIQSGSSAFYSFVVSRAGKVEISLSVPTWANKDFHPQIVLYQPDVITAGPILSMEQPDSTLASIYPSIDGRNQIHADTFMTDREVQHAQLILPVAGRYYLAVYNAGRVGGRWRLAFIGASRFADLWRWPMRWWQDQAWAGWGWQTVCIPLLPFTIAGGWWLWFEKKHPPKSKSKIIRKKKS